MNESQIIVIGIVASALTWLFKYGALYLKKKPSRLVMNIVLYVISLLFSFFWIDKSVPSLPVCSIDIPSCVGNVWSYINEWIAMGAPILGSATLIYNLLYDKVVVPVSAKLIK